MPPLCRIVCGHGIQSGSLATRISTRVNVHPAANVGGRTIQNESFRSRPGGACCQALPLSLLAARRSLSSSADENPSKFAVFLSCRTPSVRLFSHSHGTSTRGGTSATPIKNCSDRRGHAWNRKIAGSVGRRQRFQPRRLSLSGCRTKQSGVAVSRVPAPHLRRTIS